MPHYIEYRLADGGTITVESGEGRQDGEADAARTGSIGNAEPPDRGQRVGRGGTGPAIAAVAGGGNFSDALKSVRPAIEEALAVFRDLQAPDEVRIEFGVKFSASAGVILASGSGEATLKVNVKWQKAKPPAPAA